MKDFDLKKYMAEGRIHLSQLKENVQGDYNRTHEVIKSFEDGELLQSFLSEFPEGEDVSREEYEGFLERHFPGEPDPEDHRGKNWEYILSGDESVFDDVWEGKSLKENEEQGYILFTTNVEYDNGKTGYMYQLLNAEDREENEIGFDQLYFDDEDNRLKMGVDFKDFDQGSYQEGEYTADEAMKLYNDLSEGRQLKENEGDDAIKYLEDSIKYAKDKSLIKDLKDYINYLKNIPENDDLGSAILAISDDFKGAENRSSEELSIADGFKKFENIYSLG